jgi:hypothetical protein
MFASKIGERYAARDVLAGPEKLEMLMRRSPESFLLTAYLATFFDMFSGRPYTLTGRQSELSSS